MARKRFDSITGGLVDTVVAGIGNNTSAAISNAGSGRASFGINSILGGVVQDTSGYVLNAGQNYALSQMGERLGNSEKNALANAVVTQIATAGLNQAVNFVSQAIPNPFLGGSSVTTAGLGAMGARSTISIPDSVSSKLEQADYGGSAYTLQDITFTLTPANAGAQTQPPAQASPTGSWDVGFDANAAKSIPAVNALKGSTALAGPAQGLNVGGKNLGAIYGSGNQLSAAKTGLQPLKPGY